MGKSKHKFGDYENEETESWRNYRKDKQTKRQQNKDDSTFLLNQADVSYTEHNDVLHLIIQHNEDIIDFYPSTGLWIVRKKNYQRRGIGKLLKYLQK